MFSNFLMTGLTPLSATNEIHQWENRPFTTIWPEEKKVATNGSSDPKLTKVVKRKPKRFRTAYTTDQVVHLERAYARHKYLNRELRKELASALKVGEKRIIVWFQNRRMKEKKEASESYDSSLETSHQLSPSVTDSTEVETTPVSNCSSEMHKDDLKAQYQLPTYYPQFPHQFYDEYGAPVTQYSNVDSSVILPPPIPVDYNSHPTYYNDNNVYPPTYHNFYYHHEYSTAMGYEYWNPAKFEQNFYSTTNN